MNATEVPIADQFFDLTLPHLEWQPLVLSAATGYLTRNGAHNADSLHYKSLEKPPAEPPRWGE